MSTICWDCRHSGECYRNDNKGPCKRYYSTFKLMEENAIYKDGDCEEYGYCTENRCKYWNECGGY